MSETKHFGPDSDFEEEEGDTDEYRSKADDVRPGHEQEPKQEGMETGGDMNTRAKRSDNNSQPVVKEDKERRRAKKEKEARKEDLADSMGESEVEQ
ncbi:MAG: hypothetical protein ABEJ24_05315 [Candidatus Magasanikbacteria bacterium]